MELFARYTCYLIPCIFFHTVNPVLNNGSLNVSVGQCFTKRMISSNKNLPSFSSIGAIILSSDSPNTSCSTYITG